MRVAALPLSIAILIGWGGQSYADVHEVTVQRSGREPSCLTGELVADALRQDPALRVTLASQTNTDPIVLKISGSNERFTLLFVSKGREVGQLFEGVACSAAPQVVTAFVSSLLSSNVMEASPPAPAPKTDAPPLTLESDDLARAVQDELESRGFHLGAEGLRLFIVRKTRRRWTIWITNTETSCAVYRELNADHSGGQEALVMQLATLGRTMLQGAGRCLHPEVVERAEILKEAIEPFRYNGHITRVASASEAVLGIATGVLAMATATDRDLARGLVVGASGMWLAGGLASFVMDDHPYAGTVFSASALLGAATMSASLAFIGGTVDPNGEEDLKDQRHDAFLLAGLTGYATVAMLVWDRNRHPPIANSRLADGYNRLRTGIRRERLTKEEVAGIEQDFIRSQSPTSMWLLAAPVLVGGALSLGALAIEEDPEERGLFLVVGGVLLTNGLLLGAFDSIDLLDPLQRYQEQLKESGLELHLVPTGNGIAAVGRF